MRQREMFCLPPPSGHTLRQFQSEQVSRSPAQFMRRDFLTGGRVLFGPSEAVAECLQSLSVHDLSDNLKQLVRNVLLGSESPKG